MSTGLDMSIPSSRPLTFPGEQSKNGYRARWVIELGDLSSIVFQEKRKREKMKVKATMTTWSTKSKTPSRSQFVTHKNHCVAGRLMLFWHLKNIDKKTFFFTLSSFIYLTRDYRSSTARELHDLVLKRRPLTSLVFHARIVFIWKKFKSLVLPAWIFWLHRYPQSAIQWITENIHLFVSFLFVMNFPWFYANKQTTPCMSLGGFHGLMLQEKII